jgi:Spy/CpxP family protein refolding chaperone
MKRFFLQPLASFAAGALLSAQALAFDGQHRSIDWQEDLELTEHQEDQIEAIEDKYHQQFRELRKSHKQGERKPEQAHALMKQMRSEIQQVLTKEQRAEARKLMAQQRQQAMEKRLAKMARKLDMSDEQQQQLKQRNDQRSADYQWPMDRVQREQARAEFEQAMNNILTGEQQQQWQAMKARYKKRWHQEGELRRQHHYRDSHDPSHNGYDERSSEKQSHHAGFRKGYQDW